MNVLCPVGLNGKWQHCNQAENEHTCILVLVLSLLSSVTLDKARHFEPLHFSSVKTYLILRLCPRLHFNSLLHGNTLELRGTGDSSIFASQSLKSKIDVFPQLTS